MTIRTRIVRGYALSLGIALAGSFAGLFWGNYYQRQALEKQQAALEEYQLLSTLQSIFVLQLMRDNSSTAGNCN